MDLETVAQFRDAFFRLVGTDADDPELTRGGEAENEVVDTFLTRGCRNAQRYMLDCGYGGWRQRSSAITSWTGTDAANGGRHSDLPADFLRAYGHGRMSALVEANGDRWGTEIRPDQDTMQGDYYYIRGEELWLARKAAPPATLYLDHHYMHPEWGDAVVIDFPLEARYLIVAEAANDAAAENWLPGDEEMIGKIDRALVRARASALKVSRATKAPRQLRRAPRYGNRW